MPQAHPTPPATTAIPVKDSKSGRRRGLAKRRDAIAEHYPHRDTPVSLLQRPPGLF
ncbi:hypothetical protein [Microbacterium sp. 77mftsu3.1]|uniref:hypothetical protein n=1 Tax=Microbacterium sp. 77mftsu3.1 TaxID=1761802 RepID=UPI0003A76AA5|nr:hypothetical protein [Microbacterium sp. 77mftsu3.1]SDH43139.1 hypothetical protein SAMN04488590_3327 [Microbacterium sp. 77mftsu3.1]